LFNQTLQCYHSLESSLRDDSNEWSHCSVKVEKDRNHTGKCIAFSLITGFPNDIIDPINEALIQTIFCMYFREMTTGQLGARSDLKPITDPLMIYFAQGSIWSRSSTVFIATWRGDLKTSLELLSLCCTLATRSLRGSYSNTL